MQAVPLNICLLQVPRQCWGKGNISQISYCQSSAPIGQFSPIIILCDNTIQPIKLYKKHQIAEKITEGKQNIFKKLRDMLPRLATSLLFL